jgi:hypothetical protein
VRREVYSLLSQGHKARNDRAIENFIQRKTEGSPFDLLRAGNTDGGKVEERGLSRLGSLRREDETIGSHA